jgi:opacity protein-like surface antigen
MEAAVIRQTSCAWRILLGGLLLLALPVSSTAQGTPRAEFSAGWRLLQAMDFDGETDETFPAGWYADVAVNVTDAIALVGDVSGAYKSFEETFTTGGIRFDATANLKIHTFMGGVRFNARPNPRVTPFAQALFGLARADARVEATSTVAGFNFDESESENEFAIEAGGGVNLRLTDAIGVRAYGSYIRIGAEDGGNGFRFGAGLVFPF